MSENLITIENLDVNKLPELQGMKEQQIKLVEENPFIEIIDNKTFEEAKKRRTALLKGRTSLESQDKLIASKLSNFRKQVGNVTKELIEITLPHEEKQQEEVKRYEQAKENERLEKERLEQERIDKIKNKISELENQSIQTINSWDEDVLKDSDNSNFTGMDTDFDFEEFDILYQQARTRVQEHCENKIKSLQEKKNQRLENERLAREKAEAEELKAKKEAEKKAEKENKERIKRLAKDKAIYKKVLNDTLGSFPIVFDADQVEIRDFSELASNRVEELKNQLLTELENL